MDEVKINLSGKIMRGIVSKLLTKMLSEKLGCKMCIQFGELDASYVDGQVHIHASIDGDMTSTEFGKLIKTVGLD